MEKVLLLKKVEGDAIIQDAYLKLKTMLKLHYDA